MRFLAASSSNEHLVNKVITCTKKKVHKTHIINHLGIKDITNLSEPGTISGEKLFARKSKNETYL